MENFRDKNELPSLKLVKDVMYNKRETSEIMNFDKIIKKVKEKTNYG